MLPNSRKQNRTESVDVTPTAELLAAMQAPPAKQQPLPQQAPIRRLCTYSVQRERRTMAGSGHELVMLSSPRRA